MLEEHTNEYYDRKASTSTTSNTSSEARVKKCRRNNRRWKKSKEVSYKIRIKSIQDEMTLIGGRDTVPIVKISKVSCLLSPGRRNEEALLLLTRRFLLEQIAQDLVGILKIVITDTQLVSIELLTCLTQSCSTLYLFKKPMLSFYLSASLPKSPLLRSHSLDLNFEIQNPPLESSVSCVADNQSPSLHQQHQMLDDAHESLGIFRVFRPAHLLQIHRRET